MLGNRCHLRRCVRDLYPLGSRQLVPYPNIVTPLRYYNAKIPRHFIYYKSINKDVQYFFNIFVYT